MVDVTVTPESIDIDVNVTTAENTVDVMISAISTSIDVEVQPGIYAITNTEILNRLTDLEQQEHIAFNALPPLP